ncbi:MAG: MFS transporter [Gammaproteobacteria bacterium RIFCSPLOWO2_02_FULL_61_13]|nr:MAG: MFS transporter [Gammaproteobacteria bacterium RIFCSPLOWO2_02_FULL_61_13]
MSRMQVVIVAITIGLNALDGFDVLSISFASPGIAAEWGIDRARLGIVLSMELIGMGVGSILLGGVADRYGRRPTILGCLVGMMIGMFMAPAARGLAELSVWRVITGLGIGGMLAAINAVTAEFSNSRRRHLSVSLMVIGYPLGVVIGGSIAAQLLAAYDWRSVFYLGAALSVIFIPVVYFYVPESVHWLTRKQPEEALQRVNAVMARIGKAAIAALPVIAQEVRKLSAADIFSPVLIVTTLIVTIAYCFHITTFYFIIKWAPKIIVDMGFPASSAAGVLVWANLGGALGGALFGVLTLRLGLKPLTIGVLVLSAVMVNLFGRSPADLQMLSLICAAASFCTNAGVVGLYAIFASAFPTHARAFGTGFAVGVGRGGAVLSPIIAGFLLNAGSSLPTVASIMALGSVVAAGVLVFLTFSPEANRELA